MADVPEPNHLRCLCLEHPLALDAERLPGLADRGWLALVLTLLINDLRQWARPKRQDELATGAVQ